MTKVQKLLGWGCLALVAIMPFHAFLVVVAGHLFGHESIFQGWKEMLLLVLVMVSAAVVLKSKRLQTQLKKPFNLTALVFILVGLFVSLVRGNTGRTEWLFGIKTDYAMIAAFWIGQLASNLGLRRWLLRILMGSSTLVALLAIAQEWVIAPSFLGRLGYNSQTIAPIQHIDPSVSTLRAFSTLGGPNQLGAFLILPLCYLAAAMTKKLRPWHIPVGLVLLLGLITSYSRSAWLGAIFGVGVTLLISLSRKQIARLTPAAAVAVVLVAILALGPLHRRLEPVLNHNGTTTLSSNAERAGAEQSGLKAIFQNPLGLGLGTAGPASFHSDKPLITENYYLQLGVETGLLGLIAFLAWQVLTLKEFLHFKSRAVARAWAGAIVGIGVVNLFLHGWADSTLALVFWTIGGVAIGGERE